MNDLTNILDDNDKIRIGNELERLYALQDRPLSKDKKAILLDEITHFGYPIGAILAGLHSLAVEDLKTVKLADIDKAIREHMVFDEEIALDCDYCDKRGIITMKNKDGYQFALACTCANGRGFHSRGNARWNGERTQESKRHGTLFLEFADLILGKGVGV